MAVPAPPPAAPPRFAPLALFALIFVLYLPSLWNGFVYDDFVLIVDQLPPRGIGDLFSVFTERHWYNLPYYRPIARVTMVAQKFLHGDTPWPYHLFNALLMAGGATLVYALLRLPRLAVQPAFALLGAALFAAHPIASEVVYPACSGRESLIPGIFIVGALYAHLRGGGLWRMASYVLFAAAMLSKEQAIVLPAVFLLADLCDLSEDAQPLQRRNAGSGWWVARYAPFAGLAVVYLLLRRAIFGNVLKAKAAFWLDPLGPAFSLFYALQSIVLPFWQVVYEPRIEIWSSPWRFTIVLMVVGALWYAISRLELWPRVRRPLLFWAGFFLLALAPTANFLVQEARYAERFVFLSMLAFMAVLATLASALPERMRPRAMLVALVLLLGFGVVSVSRGRTYRDNITFLTQWMSTDPAATTPIASLGEVYARQRAFDQAIPYYRRAIDMGSSSPEILTALGTALVASGRTDEAFPYFQRALQVDPASTRAREALGSLLVGKGRAAEAFATYEGILRDNPKDLATRINYGNALQDAGRSAEAVVQYRKAIEIAPGVREAHYNLGRALASQGKTSDAIAAYQQAIALSPDYAYAHQNVGLLLLQEGNADAALPHFDAAFKADARLTGALASAATALMRLDRPEEALARYRTLAKAQPDDPKIRFDMGVALAKTGKREEAVNAFRETLTLAPDFPSARANLEAVERATTNDAVRRLALASSDASLTTPRAPTPDATTAPGLDEATVTAMTTKLAENPGNPVWLAASRLNPASVARMESVRTAFTKAGWTVRGTQQVSFAVKPGMFLFSGTDQSPTYLDTVLEALRAGGIEPSIGTSYLEFAEEMRRTKPGWMGFDFSSDQTYVLVVGPGAAAP